MKSENQLVNKELSQELEKAGYPQEGLWWWVKLHTAWAYCSTYWLSRNMLLREGGE